MQLSDFFAPLNPTVLSQLLLIFLALDIIGTQIARWFQFSSLLRLAHWVIGLGVLVSVWFVLHWFLPFLTQYIWISLACLTVFSLPNYWQQRSWKPLVDLLVHFPYPLLILLLFGFVKPLYYHTSLPPRVWDDMAYHFYSPYRVFHEPQWNFASDMIPGELSFYDMLPRWLDTAYVLAFSLTHTYAAAQVIHLALTLTAIWTAGWWLHKRIGFLSGIVFVWLCFGLNTGILLSATIGYVDAGAGSLALLGLIALAEFCATRKLTDLNAVATLAALAMGTKYTNIIFPIVSSVLAMIMVGLTQRRYLTYWWNTQTWREKVALTLKTGVMLAVIGLSFGGYWYLKNIAISGNPMYPFVFGCHGCKEEQNVLKNWGYAEFNQQNQPLIVKALFYQEPMLYELFFIAATLGLWLALWQKKRLTMTIITLVFASIVTEIFVVRLISPFELRFFYHWQFLIPLILCLPFQRLPLPWQRWQSKSMMIGLCLVIAYAAFLHHLTKPLIDDQRESLSDIEKIDTHNRAYVLGQLSFAQWVQPMMPHLFPVIEWCGQPKNEVATVLVADPEIIWNYDGLARAFFVNCRFTLIQDPDNLTPELAIAQVSSAKDDTYILSAVECGRADLVYTNPFQAHLFSLNQALICKSEEVLPNLYRLKSD